MKLTRTRTCLATVCSVLIFAGLALALPGDLDLDFGTGGRTVVGIGFRDFARSVLIQPDGKVLMAGYTSDGGNPENFDISLVRLNANGTPDNGFGSAGRVQVLENGNQVANAVVLREGGKILIVGSDLGYLTAYQFTPEGNLDITFGNGGKITHVVGLEGAGNDLVIAPDGKIIVAGFVRLPNEAQRFTVFRMLPNGQLDTDFSSVGFTPVLFGGTFATTVALQSDGQIIAGGRSDNTGYWGRFGSNGVLEGGVSALVSSSVLINDLAILPDGKIIGVGYTNPSGGGARNFGVTRFNPNRTVDRTFGNGGVTTVGWPSSFNNMATSVIIQPSGRILLGGQASSPTEFGIVRLNKNGFPDIGFGVDGRVTTDFGDSSGIGAMVAQADGKFVAVGNVNFSGNFDYAIARYDGSDSATGPSRALFDYDGDGRADISVFRPSDAVWYIYYSWTNTIGIRSFGIANDRPAPADYTGDGKSEIAIHRSNGAWWWLVGNTPTTHTIGAAGNAARPGDYNGDGRADFIGYTEGGFWNRSSSVGVSTSNVNFGLSGDKSLLGDFDGDGLVDPSIYRPSTGEWWYAASSAAGQHRATRWGISTDIPTAADFDGDMKTDCAVYRPSEGRWYIFNSSDLSYTIMNFGLAEDKPIPADYDGDGKADIAVYRPSTGVWYIMRSTAGFTAMHFGISTDIPTPNAYVP